MVGAGDDGDSESAMLLGELPQVRQVGDAIVIADQHVDRYGDIGQPSIAPGGKQEMVESLGEGVPRVLQAVEENGPWYRRPSDAGQTCC